MRALCSLKEARHKRTNNVGLLEVAGVVKFVELKSRMDVTRAGEEGMGVGVV